MDNKVIHGLVQRLALKPTEGSKLAVFLTRINNKSDLTNGSNASEVTAQTNLIDDADHKIIDYLKRLQVIKLTRPILDLCV